MLVLIIPMFFGHCWTMPRQEYGQSNSANIEPYKEEYINQYIDHFNYLGQAGNNGMYKERYLVSEKSWKGNGPILFYCGNEGSIVNFWNNTGFMFALAEELGALVVFAEHRYYGKSLPFGEDSFQPKNIGFLSIEQALADYAILIKHLQKEYKAYNASVFAMGGSYGGLLAGYMRYKYPHLIHGAVASSAPFLTIAGKRPRNEFFHSVTETFRKADPSCPASVQEGFVDLEKLFDRTESLWTIAADFNLCASQFQKSYFRENMLAWLRNAFVLLAMVDYPYPANFMADLPGHPVNQACKYMKDSNKLKGLAAIAKLLYGDKVVCHDTFKEYVSCSDPTGCGTGPDNPPWDYQACTEMVLPGGSNNKTDMFPPLPFTLEMRAHYCQGKFGLGYPRNNWLGIEYFGSLEDIKKSSNIIFPNGDLDPWMSGGVLENLSPSLIAIMIEGGAHHLDLRAANKDDPPSVVSARKEITDTLKKWMK